MADLKFVLVPDGVLLFEVVETAGPSLRSG
jgi:hypothetical protein